MTYTILDISELNNIDYSEVPNHSSNTVRTSLNGLQFIIKYDVKPSFITDETEYTHSQILYIVSGSDWIEYLGV
jgi:hypothetical protein